jgi:hypothetical protein
MTETVQNEIDWEAVEYVAQKLGLHTRKLVGERDVDAIADWALEMERQNYDTPAASYHELAALLGRGKPAPVVHLGEPNDDDEETPENDDE